MKNNPFNRVEAEPGTWMVLCLVEGRYELATHSGFTTRKDAARYASSVAADRKPLIARLEEPPMSNREVAPTEPQEGRIPIPDRPKVGETWLCHMGWEVTITHADPWGRSFKYERLDERGNQKFGTIGQLDIRQGDATRVDPNPHPSNTPLEETP